MNAPNVQRFVSQRERYQETDMSSRVTLSLSKREIQDELVNNVK